MTDISIAIYAKFLERANGKSSKLKEVSARCPVPKRDVAALK